MKIGSKCFVLVQVHLLNNSEGTECRWSWDRADVKETVGLQCNCQCCLERQLYHAPSVCVCVLADSWFRSKLKLHWMFLFWLNYCVFIVELNCQNWSLCIWPWPQVHVYLWITACLFFCLFFAWHLYIQRIACRVITMHARLHDNIDKIYSAFTRFSKLINE